MEEENQEKKVPETKQESHHEKKPMTEKLRSNPWILSTLVLGIFAIILIVSATNGLGLTGNVITADQAASIIVNFAEDQTGEAIQLVEVTEDAGLYQVVILYQENEIPLYLTKDGKNLVQGLTPLDALTAPTSQPTPQPTNVPKSDKPQVELFVMTHCPYGTQAEKGFIPAIGALGDNVDATIRFVHYFMHDPEETETPIQVCIREEQSDKWLGYLACFLEDGDTDRCISETEIDQDALDACVADKSEEYYAADSALSEEYGVQGSPTLVINGVVVSSGRSPDGFLQTICGAFNEAPEVCDVSLGSQSPSPGFGYTVSGSDTQAQC